MTAPGANAPDWDEDQLTVILEPSGNWQLVIAGPGAGKSAVACQRVAFLVDEGVPPSRMLLVSFTRTAVSELRDRIVSFAVAGERARSVRISTLDAHAWSLRSGFEDIHLSLGRGNDSYELSIERTIDLFRKRQPDLCDFMNSLEHLLIDEAQDIIGVRADLVLEMLRALSETCGVTILADPAQAIYGFTSDDNSSVAQMATLVDRLETESPRALIRRTLSRIHRIKSAGLLDVFKRTREKIEYGENTSEYVRDIQRVIRETCDKSVKASSYTNIADFLLSVQTKSMLVLFRGRADVLSASSYCSAAGIAHRLRMSGLPTVVRPWLGWMFWECEKSFIGKEEFDRLWDMRASTAAAPFMGEHRDHSWSLLHRLSAGRASGTIDLVQLRQLIARARPPIELCEVDVGSDGPILGTIHASKGREADTVVLFMSPPAKRDDADGPESDEYQLEEGRIYYVGATRARKLLIAADSKARFVSYLDSKRVYRQFGPMKAQFEVGRKGDVDVLAHLNWRNAADVQRTLALCSGATTPAISQATEEHNYVPRLSIKQVGADGFTRFFEVGQLSEFFHDELGKLWSRVDKYRNLRPAPTINHLYLTAVTTVGITDEQRGAVGSPFNHSGLALAPIVKGFPMIQFLYRKSRRSN